MNDLKITADLSSHTSMMHMCQMEPLFVQHYIWALK